MKVLIHHGEIFLKKGNFSFFEKKLVGNIKKSCSKNNLNLIKIERKNKRILCEFDETDESKVRKVIGRVLGIKYFAFISEIEKEFYVLEECIRVLVEVFKKEGIKEIAFKTKRSDKNFPKNSMEINEELGEMVHGMGLSFNYTHPEKTIYIEISKNIYVYTKRHEGFGGLPVGTGGKVICLLSGGIDSPVAAWLMMKRGCEVDFLHFHAFKDNKHILEEENLILEQIEKLNEYQYNSKVYTLPYHNYMLSIGNDIFEEYDLVIFKHYMMKLAERLAEKKGYNAIVTGDNLAQVASQTIENLRVVEKGVDLPILRPLLGYDKEEIISLAKSIRTYDTSIKNYKDCCSILARKPSTKTKMDKFEKEIGKINLPKMIEDGFNEIDSSKID